MARFGKKNKADMSEGTPAASTAVNAAKANTPAAVSVTYLPDVYTLLLGLSAGAMLIAVVLLYLNIAGYGPDPLSGIPKAN